MQWTIKYYNISLETEILALPEDLLARYFHLTRLIQDYGPNLGMPHSRALGNGLFELRLIAKEGIARVFYCYVINNEILILYVFIKKQQKIPLHILRFIKNRLQEVKEYDKKNSRRIRKNSIIQI